MLNLKPKQSYEQGTILNKAKEIALKERITRPVIVILNNPVACHKFHQKLGNEKTFVFDASRDEVSRADSVLDQLQKSDESPHLIILTTSSSSIGITFFKKAYVIMTEEP